ncbi:cullin-associated NEDD8-dissociated protein 1 [Corchorus capsularis]|uniref:Cullin-associated NEDD8-dissociated protein 1 n=1 Tax=Corchorus capsularis TaxID=210143 RepID=A0A1R3IJY4_COCAP|nr:cullin-associated NEDD8-dissociated protein 1 [Corchorus capsularis]
MATPKVRLIICGILIVLCVHMLAAADSDSIALLKKLDREMSRFYGCILPRFYQKISWFIASESCAELLSNMTLPAPPDSDSIAEDIENTSQLNIVSLNKAYSIALKEFVAAAATHCNSYEFYHLLRLLGNNFRACVNPRAPFSYIIKQIEGDLTHVPSDFGSENAI